MDLILASASLRRRELLGRLVVEFRVAVSGVEETPPAGAAVKEVVESLALQKALAVSRDHPGVLVLGADTSIELDGKLLGKPDHRTGAAQMLKSLRGRPHKVWTGLALVGPEPRVERVSAVASEVVMRAFSEAEIQAYVNTGEPMDKAGAYAIQQRGGNLVEAIRGCYYNIVGLPLCEAARMLHSAGHPISVESGLCKLPHGSPCPRWQTWVAGLRAGRRLSESN